MIKLAKLKKIKFKKIHKFIKPFIYAFAILGIISLVMIGSFFNLLDGKPQVSLKPIPKNAIISLNLNQKFQESPNLSLFSGIKNTGMTYFDLIKSLNIAMLDDNVKAIIANINTTGLGLAQIQNLQNTIKQFRKQGKKAYIFSSGMGNLGQGTDEYYLSTAFDKIYMQPNSELGITGIGIEIPFLGDSLQKLGIDAEFYTRHEYKNAASSITHGYFPPQYKQQMTNIGKKLYESIVSGIADNRKLTTTTIKQLINQAPLSAEDALQHKLIDGIAYYSDVEQQLKQKYQGKIISLSDYAANFTTGSKKLPSIAYLPLEGTIIEGDNSDASLSGELLITSDYVVKTIRDIEKNPNIKALILRINSPGGSYSASNTIWYELNRLKQKRNIPIVVSMGNYAASGGYFIALSGDKIYAEPMSFTGSIGVLGGKIVAADLWKKLDINWGNIQFGDNAGIISNNHKFSQSEKKAFNKSLDNIYKDFTQKVSASRNIEISALDNVARGRVWLGMDAVENGLIDGIGGIDIVLKTAKELGGIAPNQKFDIVSYPKPKTIAEKFNEILRFYPQISINQLATKMGLDIQGLIMLKQMQYDCILTPFIIRM